MNSYRVAIGYLFFLLIITMLPSLAYATRGPGDKGMIIGIGLILLIIICVIFVVIKLIRFIIRKK